MTIGGRDFRDWRWKKVAHRYDSPAQLSFEGRSRQLIGRLAISKSRP